MHNCAVLFGDHQELSQNKRLRRKGLDWIEEDADGITIAHSVDSWQEPTPMHFRGLQLLRTTGQGPQSRAIFLVSDDLARRTGCAAGSYALGVDHRLSQTTRILAVLQKGVLVQHKKELRFIPLPNTGHPRWFVAWRMRADLPAGALGPARYVSYESY